VATQRGDVSSLGSAALRENLPYKVQLGLTSNSASTLQMTLNCAPDEIPAVPKHLMSDDDQQRRDKVPGPTWLKGAGFMNADGQLGIAKGWWFDPKRFATDEPWKSLAAENLRNGYGTSLSPEEVARLTRIPLDIVRQMMGIKVEVVDDDAPAAKVKAPKAARQRVAAGDEELELGAWEPTSPELCSACDMPINPATGECRGCT
jgi:hypothetical protein